MPLIRESKFVLPYLAYDAPENEKTMRLREKFDVDPETGYPRNYNWRTMAMLGKEYRPEEAIEKLLPFKEESMYSTYIVNAVSSFGIALAFQVLWNYHKARNWYSRPFVFFGTLAASGGMGYYLCTQTPHRQGMENAIYLDYLRNHPDRFETRKRYKHREVVLHNNLARSS